MSERLLFVGTPDDQPYLQRLKSLVGTASVFVALRDKILTFTEIEVYAKSKGCTGIFSTHADLLAKVLMEPKASIDNYAGSYFTRNGLEVVFIHPLSHLVRVPYGSFLNRRYISKLTDPKAWNSFDEFGWTCGSESNAATYFDLFQHASIS